MQHLEVCLPTTGLFKKFCVLSVLPPSAKYVSNLIYCLVGAASKVG